VTRGYRPVVAIKEAQQAATDHGCLVIGVSSPIPLPFDFIISDHGRISLVRVRRLRYGLYEVPDIADSCRREIFELRSIRIPEEYSRELHIRGPSRYWRRYRILEDSIEEMQDENPLKNSNGRRGWGNQSLSDFSMVGISSGRSS
jgi:hypothetical protein